MQSQWLGRRVQYLTDNISGTLTTGQLKEGDRLVKV